MKYKIKQLEEQVSFLVGLLDERQLEEFTCFLINKKIKMAKKTTTKKNSKVSVSYRGASIFEVANYVHHETVRHCEYCGKPMSRSDVNDYGSLCESCYMKEYYG